MRKFSRNEHFPVTVWARDCYVPDHRLYDVPYQIIKCCADCEVYTETFDMDFIKKYLHWRWMKLPMIEIGD